VIPNHPLESPIVYPVAANFNRWFNQNGSVLTDLGDAVNLSAPAGGAGQNMNGVAQAAPATPWVVKARVQPQIIHKNYHSSGVFIGDMTTGRLITCTANAFDNQIVTSNWTTGTAFVGDIGDDAPHYSWGTTWFKLEDNGTNIVISISMTGLDSTWLTIYTAVNTAWLAAPDSVGICAQQRNQGNPLQSVSTTLQSWAVS